MEIHTERLILRPVSAADLDDLVAMSLYDRETGAFLGAPASTI